MYTHCTMSSVLSQTKLWNSATHRHTQFYMQPYPQRFKCMTTIYRLQSALHCLMSLHTIYGLETHNPIPCTCLCGGLLYMSKGVVNGEHMGKCTTGVCSFAMLTRVYVTMPLWIEKRLAQSAACGSGLWWDVLRGLLVFDCLPVLKS